MDGGRFSISADVPYQRLGNWPRDRTGDQRVTAYCVHGREVHRNLPNRLAIFCFKSGTFQTLLACSAAGLLVHLGGAAGPTLT
jgi:hypothetical protein